MSTELLRQAADVLEACQHPNHGADGHLCAPFVAMSPLAKAVSSLLRNAADNHDDTACPAVDGALAVARAVLGEATSGEGARGCCE